MGGVAARVPNDQTAFTHRDRRFFTTILGLWLDPDDDPARHKDWTEALWQKIRDEADGVYVNFLGDEGDDRIREAYPKGAYERLVQVKQAYDPGNVFRFNQNIRPRD
jgi:FAD/FMN-containing dehydrogenase